MESRIDTVYRHCKRSGAVRVGGVSTTFVYDCSVCFLVQVTVPLSHSVILNVGTREGARPFD